MSEYTEEELDKEYTTLSGQKITRRELLSGRALERLEERDEARRKLAPELLRLMISRPGDMSGLKDYAAAAVGLSVDLQRYLDQRLNHELEEIEETQK